MYFLFFIKQIIFLNLKINIDTQSYALIKFEYTKYKIIFKVNRMKKSYLIILIFLVNIFTACGTSDSNSSTIVTEQNETPISSVVRVGRFIDAPVDGLRYKTPTHSGMTNALGQFLYNEGEEVEFSLADLSLGKAKASAIVTPLTLAGDTDINNMSLQSTIIGQLLQTLDDGSSNGASLRIRPLLDDMNIADFNLTSQEGIDNILLRARWQTGVYYTLKDAAAAQENMKRNIEFYQSYEPLVAGTYSGKGEKSYLLSMPIEGNIVLDWKSATTSIYDTDMNRVFVNSSGGNYLYESESINLAAGNYIVKANYLGTGGSIKVNSNVLLDQNTLTPISYGKYTGSDSLYYLLSMPSAGNVILDTQNASAHLYDIQLNPIGGAGENVFTASEPLALSEGKYVLKIDYTSSASSVLLNSNVLYNQENFPNLYYGKSYGGGETTYYKIDMTTDGGIVINSTNAIAYLYDINLSKKDTNATSGRNSFMNDERRSLSKGVYVVKVDYDSEGGIITLE